MMCHWKKLKQVPSYKEAFYRTVLSVVISFKGNFPKYVFNIIIHVFN